MRLPNRETPTYSRLLSALFSIALLTALVGLAGCESNPYSSVSGTVMYKGKPVPNGEIRLTPDSRQGNKGPAVVAMIKNGAYATPEGKGIVGGDYQLRIMGYASKIKSNDPTAPEFGASLFETQTQSVHFPSGEDCIHDITVE